jgi:hypothetical protein
MMRPVGAALAALLLSSCGDALGPSEIELRVLRHRLERAEARWEEHGPASYTLTLQRLCYCGEIEPRQVTVIDGVVTDVRIVGSGAPLTEDQWQWYPSVEALFAIVRQAIDERAHELEPEFHDTLGYALRVEIDWDEHVADEEVTFIISSFVSY